MTAVRAKFKLVSKTIHEHGYVTLKYSAVTSGSTENEQFWKYTPSGSIELSCVKSSADLQDVGQEYYIDFSNAAPVAAGAGL